MPQKTAIDELLKSTPRLWKGSQSGHRSPTLPTGQSRLDARLPGGGWPLAAVSEIISTHPGLGEFSLLLPVLAEISSRGQWVVLIDPPWQPYPASLQGNGLPLEHLLLVRSRSEKESLWACEQALRAGRGGAVLAWPERIGFSRLRRLQLAAEAQAKLGFLFRPESAAHESSPVALRLLLQAGERGGTRLSVLKCRGSRPSESLWLARPHSYLPDAAYGPASIMEPEVDTLLQADQDSTRPAAPTAIN
ncbi:MAG: translesion DNA synthesis-associated protein ImuA [Xanthomonadales bacterium]|nr:translesion DNA synthesis-associated protein ImuA [Xanthomonadales bacterium]